MRPLRAANRAPNLITFNHVKPPSPSRHVALRNPALWLTLHRLIKPVPMSTAMPRGTDAPGATLADREGLGA